MTREIWDARSNEPAFAKMTWEIRLMLFTWLRDAVHMALYINRGMELPLTCHFHHARAMHVLCYEATFECPIASLHGGRV